METASIQEGYREYSQAAKAPLAGSWAMTLAVACILLLILLKM
jgi:hypothetical protein